MGLQQWMDGGRAQPYMQPMLLMAREERKGPGSRRGPDPSWAPAKQGNPWLMNCQDAKGARRQAP